MFRENLFLIYRLFLDEGRQRVDWIEQYLNIDGDIGLSLDDRRNAPSAYKDIFSSKHQSIIEEIYLNLLSEMNGMSYNKCDDILKALSFIQEISATALWKYHQSLGVRIEKFVRDFDRLDAPSERIRLYENAQTAVSEIAAAGPTAAFGGK
jgi:hypothetical protein